MGNCHPSKTNVNLGDDISFRGVTISHVTLSCSQYLYNIIRFFCTYSIFYGPVSQSNNFDILDFRYIISLHVEAMRVLCYILCDNTFKKCKYP